MGNYKSIDQSLDDTLVERPQLECNNLVGKHCWTFGGLLVFLLCSLNGTIVALQLPSNHCTDLDQLAVEQQAEIVGLAGKLEHWSRLQMSHELVDLLGSENEHSFGFVCFHS